MMPPEDTRRPLDSLLTAVFDQLSNRLAGGRVHPNDLLPGSDDPQEGIIPDDFRPDVTTFDWFDPTDWARPGGEMGVDMSHIQPASGPGQEGEGGDWFRGGEAPNNYVNRHNPLYKARREFAVSLAPKLEEMFGVSAQGSAGHMRQPDPSHAAPGGPSSNSDHYSGGAIDFFGDTEQLQALRDWLVQQPYVSFVRWQSESHWDHVHASFDLGWVAQNYFQGQQLPAVHKPASQPTASTSQPSSHPTDPAGPTGGGGATPV